MRYREIIEAAHKPFDTEAFKAGQKVGKENQPRSINPYSDKIPEWREWDSGWLDG